MPSPDAGHGVIVRADDARVLLSVTRLVGWHELVTRPLPAGVAERATLAGGAVLADGQIALIVDCDALAACQRNPVSTESPTCSSTRSRELANIGSGTASTALSSLLGRSVDISVPTAAALQFADAVDAVGPAERVVTGVVIGVGGDMTATVLLLLGEGDAAMLCGLLGVDPADEPAASALGEIGNIVGASYINALAAMTGLQMAPEPPQSATDMLRAIVASVLAGCSSRSSSAPRTSS